ncbi:MAG: pyruvate, phosphate dikinase [Chloroflexi bacterium]|nr:pyruvate, phosphate dikinase [Chloroflexota bacterium]
MAVNVNTRVDAQRWVFLSKDAPDPGNKDLLGGKGAGLAQMTQAGLPVPPAFTITTEACNAYQESNDFPPGMWEQAVEALREIEAETGKRLGDAADPLLVSVRSGAKFSMPGMMDTVLNLGLNDETVQGLARQTNNERFAWDAYRRFIQMFGRIVMGVSGEKLDHVFDAAKKAAGTEQDTDLTAEQLRAVAQELKQTVEREAGRPFPTDVMEQLALAIKAVFGSWMGKRAVDYRNEVHIAHDLGTAVNVVAMVFGNMGDDSGTGVAFTRNPSTGEKKLFGEFLPNAQGEDVVAGIRTPIVISRMQEVWPEVYAEFQAIADTLEATYKDVQDLEFTVERGKLYMLQTRNAKRTGRAAVVTAVQMVDEGILSREDALKRVDPTHVQQLLVPQFDEAARKTAGKPLGKGLAASPGAAVGKLVFDPDRAEQMTLDGESVILARKETSPEDFHGMARAKGILTSRGGMTSHAAVVARQMGKPCIAGAEEIDIDVANRRLTAGGVTLYEGDWASMDAALGEVYAGRIPTVEPDIERDRELATLLGWADDVRTLGVHANADTPGEATRARALGAVGIGLCRTEHMFRDEGRLEHVRDVILNALDAKRARKEATPDASLQEARERYEAGLRTLGEFQVGDFYGILKAMDGLPVIIRLIDPPLHEFLPSRERLMVEVALADAAGRSGTDLDEMRLELEAVERFHEQNPMLGLRGCRLGILFPEIVEMQVRAIALAAARLKSEGLDPRPKIMIPLVGTRGEMVMERTLLERVVKDVLAAEGSDVAYKIGTMIELPRACMVADQIAESAEFFSFGTNDLTQTTFGYSRDDAEGKFLGEYVESGILPINPFETLDRDGVAELMKIAIEKGRKARSGLEIGICGEHGGDPASVQTCHELGLNYVSCSPGRVPIARLAAAHAALGHVPADR